MVILVPKINVLKILFGLGDFGHTSLEVQSSNLQLSLMTTEFRLGVGIGLPSIGEQSCLLVIKFIYKKKHLHASKCLNC